MNNPFQPYTSEIVTRLIKMDRDESRAWFTAIRAYIERRAGAQVASIHEYVTAPAKDEAEIEERRAVLGSVVGALKLGALNHLDAEFVEQGNG